MDVGFVLSYKLETISFSCREMMAMGKPVIVSNYGGLHENITDRVDGYITQAMDINSIKECIIEIIKHQHNLTQMSKNARKKAVKLFTKAKFVNATLAIYRNLISNRFEK